MAKKQSVKIGIALGSGGAKGLAHIGVLKVLEANDIEVNFVAGSSIGSLIGAYYAAHPDLDKLENLIYDLNTRKGILLFDPVLRGGLIKGNKIERFIADTLEGATFDSLKIPFAAVATDFNTAKEVILSKGNLIKAIRASISVPAILRPVIYNQKLLADGGLSNPIPCDVVRKMGSDIVIAVNLDTAYLDLELNKAPALRKIPMHSINVLRHNLALRSVDNAEIVISPRVQEVGLIGWDYFFDTKKAKKIIKAGEDAALEKLPGLLKLIEQKQKEKRGFMRHIPFFRNL